MIQKIESDVLVIGGGDAGARAALEAHKAGASVTLALKGRFGVTGVRRSGATGSAGSLHLFSSPKEIVKSGDDPTKKTYLDIPAMERAQIQEIFYQRMIQSGLVGIAAKLKESLFGCGSIANQVFLSCKGSCLKF